MPALLAPRCWGLRAGSSTGRHSKIRIGSQRTTGSPARNRLVEHERAGRYAGFCTGYPVATIYLGGTLPCRSSSSPGNSASRVNVPYWPCSGRGLPCDARHRASGALLPHLFTLTRAAGGLFSVALSRGLPRVGVTHRPALRSPDVPRFTRVSRGRLAGPVRTDQL